MIPLAARAAIRAAVEDAYRHAHESPAAVAEEIVTELVEHGWTITLDDSGNS
ncbi:hypothetical protein ACGH2B_12400 [Streptomyces sp. BBFR2]|uniref:hypothetical protein n=1 Tax=Streptomyces sp. BBFR2 TaxID=3372854 RepID=UPI0037D9DA72